MAETAAPPVEQVAPKPSELLHSQGEFGADQNNQSEGIRRDIQRGKDLRVLIESKIPEPSRDSVREVLKQPSTKISKKDFDKARLEFGAGDNKKVVDGRIVEGDNIVEDIKDPDNRDSYIAGSEKLRSLRTLVDYTQVQQEISRGKPEEQVLQERNINRDDWINARDEALNTLLQTPGFAEAFGITDLNSDQAREAAKQYVDEGLAKRPDFAENVAKHASAVLAEAQNLPPIAKDKQSQDALDRERSMDARINFSLDQVNDILVRMGVSDETTRKQVSDALKENMQYGDIGTAGSVDKIRNVIMAGDENLRTLVQVDIEDANIAHFEQRLQEAQDNAGMFTRMNPLAKDQEIQRMKKALDSARGEKIKAKTKRDQLEDRDPNAYRAAEAKQKYLDGLTANGDQPGQQGAVAMEIRALADAQKGKLEAQRVQAERKAVVGPELQASKQARLEAEARLMDKMDEVVPEAISDTIAERYDKADSVRREKLGEEADAKLKNVRDAVDSRWIQVDRNTGKPTVNTDKLVGDVRFLAHHGEEGVQRMILREMQAGQQTKDGQMASWETIDLAKLTEGDKIALDNAMKKYGDVFRTKLLGDYDEAKTLLSNRGFGREAGKLKLHPYEMKKLAESQEKPLTESLQQSSEGQQILQQANSAAESFQPDPNNKLETKKVYWMREILKALAATGGSLAAATVK